MTLMALLLLLFLVSDCILFLLLPHRQVKQSQELAKEDTKPFEHKDYSLKQGEKIHISLGVSSLKLCFYDATDGWKQSIPSVVVSA